MLIEVLYPCFTAAMLGTPIIVSSVWVSKKWGIITIFVPFDGEIKCARIHHVWTFLLSTFCFVIFFWTQAIPAMHAIPTWSNRLF